MGLFDPASTLVRRFEIAFFQDEPGKVILNIVPGKDYGKGNLAKCSQHSWDDRAKSIKKSALWTKSCAQKRVRIAG